MKKKNGVITLIVMVLVIAGVCALAYFGIGKDKAGSISDIKLGLDLAGGVSITYEAAEENPTQEDMNDTKYKLQKRVESYSTESEVYLEGSDRINVDIPGVSDANQILQELGEPGSLEFLGPDGDTVLTGNDIESAEAVIYEDDMKNKSYQVSLKLTDEGAEKFADVTAENVGEVISIIYDGETISEPVIQQAITGGEVSITNIASYEEAEKLATTIRIGSLPVELKELRSNVVGAKLGQEAISTSLLAGAIGLGIVIIFMIIVYLVPGFAASLALVLYTGIIIVLLSIFDITLTLPGIAGIVLSIGMAVDANVIIFARIREELATGKTVRSAIKIGFDKALSAIVDGNVTTLIAAIVLGIKGSGTVKGFAQTLALGIVVSMFTALVITRVILNALYAVGFRDAKFYGVPKEKKTINFLGKKHIFIGVSCAVIILGFVFLFINKSTTGNVLNYSLDFVGGSSTSVTFNEDLSMEEIDSEVKPVIYEITKDGSIQTQKVANSNEVIIKTRELTVDERQEISDALAEKFGVEESVIQTESISSTISSEMKSDAVVAVMIATVCMLIYIWFRFKNIRFAASAVLALVHDVLVVLAFYAVAKISVGSTFIACMLTIVGYSINATIVIFDRIRENMKLGEKGDLKELVNRSITQTLGRSINTSLTTLIMVVVLYIMGVTSIKEFALPLIVGIVCGAYSSVCITGALWYLFTTKIKGKSGKK
jgi:SecD/SecF fusion protein